jgi:hypothetical protein
MSWRTTRTPSPDFDLEFYTTEQSYEEIIEAFNLFNSAETALDLLQVIRGLAEWDANIVMPIQRGGPTHVRFFDEAPRQPERSRPNYKEMYATPKPPPTPAPLAAVPETILSLPALTFKPSHLAKLSTQARGFTSLHELDNRVVRIAQETAREIARNTAAGGTITEEDVYTFIRSRA